MLIRASTGIRTRDLREYRYDALATELSVKPRIGIEVSLLNSREI